MIESATSKLKCAYFPINHIEQASALGNTDYLGTVCFSGQPYQQGAALARQTLVHVPMPSLPVSGGTGAACELWSGDGKISHGQHQRVQFSHNDSLLFGAIQFDETEFAASEMAGSPLQQAAEAAYRAIFSTADATGFPHILRFWNYVADINGESHGLERYRQFNMGRQDGFLHSAREVTGHAVPPASAVGFASGPLTIYFLAGRNLASTAIENARQVSAYDYPREYGPRSPTFSRASVAHFADHDVLFLSGTASIVGHRTLHVGDVLGQVRETMTNIAALVSEANRVASKTQFALKDLCYKVYVRHAQDVGIIHDELRRVLGPSTPLLFLQADICRQDLLMEIEATAGHPLEFALKV